VAATVLTGLLSADDAYAGFANETILLVVVAFLVAHAVMKCGLGNRAGFLFSPSMPSSPRHFPATPRAPASSTRLRCRWPMAPAPGPANQAGGASAPSSCTREWRVSVCRP